MLRPSKELKREKIKFTGRLLDWYIVHKRDFPWRRTRNPYANLIAEALLRKTTSRQVAKTFSTFMKKYPSPAALLSASLKEIEKDLKSLGIYKVRARQLKGMAKILIRKYRGRIPKSATELLELPGVNIYSANAVLCFAYGESVPIVDTNVARVLQRVFGVKTKKKQPSADYRLWDLARQLVPLEKSREFNWALLDFAAGVCKARKPFCSKCPLTHLCMSVNRHLEFTASGVRYDL